MDSSIKFGHPGGLQVQFLSLTSSLPVKTPLATITDWYECLKYYKENNNLSIYFLYYIIFLETEDSITAQHMECRW